MPFTVRRGASRTPPQRQDAPSGGGFGAVRPPVTPAWKSEPATPPASQPWMTHHTEETGTPRTDDGWLFTGEQIERERKRAAARASGMFELFLIDGVRTNVAFVDNSPLASFNRYYVPGKGPRCGYFSCPPPGKDLWEHYGISNKPTYCEVYEVVRPEYVNSEKETIKEPRVLFMLVTSKTVMTRLRYLASDFNKGMLKGMMVRISVIGKGTDKSTNVDYLGSVEGDVLKAFSDPDRPLKRLGIDKVRQCYQPPTLEEQADILGVEIPDHML